MDYGSIEYGILHRKLNRFIAEVFIHGELEAVHIKNTGRLKELLVPGANVILEKSNNPNRKTKYSLIAVYKEDRLINIDSQVPNVVVYDAILTGEVPEIGSVDTLKREVTYGSSRFDLYYEKEMERGFIEVKGVTLENDGVAMFPDAPTKRGTKHVKELMQAVDKGYKAFIIFVIQMKGCDYFTPHWELDEDFARSLNTAWKHGVQVIAYDTLVMEDRLLLDKSVSVRL